MGHALGGSLLTIQCMEHWRYTAIAVNPMTRRVSGLGMAETKQSRRPEGLADCAWRNRNITMNKLIHVGFGNIVNTEKIIAIVSPDAAPIKRLVQKAKETGMAIDATQGRKTKSVLVMENNQVVLSALLPETIAGRAQEDLAPEEEKED